MMSNRWALCMWSLLLGVVAGCGGAERSEPAVVSPPPATPTEKPAPSQVDRPGGIEMPSGEVPPATSEGPAESKGGIEMPEGAKVPLADPSASTDSASGESKASEPIDIQYGTWEEIESLAKSSGRITVVDLWSLGCEPCLREFPGLVRLQKALGPSVQCIAVDLDFDGRASRPPEYYEEQVASFLRSVDAGGISTFISQTPSDEVFAATQLDSIPAVLIYDAKGGLSRAFVDTGETAGFTYDDDVIPLVKKLAG